MSPLRSLVFVALVAGLAGPAAAACYADYKAKRDGPLQLHYGVIELPDRACADPSRAARAIQRRIATEGWELLNVLGTFGAEGLAERQGNAGPFYLRY